ncbi:periplasmic thiol:disulfide interchange protein DsbA [alpha proteobacterium U9-1i]|nr:periplasmic thiol:disulfide interchange protein DsbA [alpha proteobacterium U9-1i]
MFAVDRRVLLVGAGALGLAGCDGASGSANATADDMVLGADNAPVTIIEYASTTCGHCARFHHDVWAQLKANYIDTGKVRFIFREFPTDPAAIAVAGFQLARCNSASQEQYFTRLTVLFEQQQAIFATGSMAGVRDKFIEIGGGAGLSEEQVMQCINDPAGAERVRRIGEGASQFQVTGTPTLIINGEKTTDPAAYTYEGLARLIDAAAS